MEVKLTSKISHWPKILLRYDCQLNVDFYQKIFIIQNVFLNSLFSKDVTLFLSIHYTSTQVQLKTFLNFKSKNLYFCGSLFYLHKWGHTNVHGVVCWFIMQIIWDMPKMKWNFPHFMPKSWAEVSRCMPPHYHPASGP